MDLDVNGVRARITNGGDLWWDGNSFVYQVTADDYSPPVNAPTAMKLGGLVLGTLDPSGRLKVASQYWERTRGWFDYYAGPLTDQGIAEGDCSEWDRLFPIYRWEINQLLDDLSSGSLLSITDVPDNIAGWPATGNPYFEGVYGFTLPSSPQGLAPFWDENQDGIYDPLNGDYPLFCGDQAIWSVFNDAGDTHRSSQGEQLQAEIHLLAYAYASEDSLLHRTTFYDYKVINRSQEDYLGLYAGHWIDPDLGCHFNDQMNSVPERNMFYVYKREGMDYSICGIRDTTYGDNAPVNIYQVLRADISTREGESGLMAACVNFYSVDYDPPPELLQPGRPTGIYNVMQGKWSDGAPITRSRQGYESGGDTTRYSFDGGLQEDGSPWWYCNNDIGLLDINQVYSTGPYDLRPGETVEFTLAISSVFRVPFPDTLCPDTSAVYAAADHIKDIYDVSCTFPISTAAPLSPTSIGLEVFPNPTSGVVTFRLAGSARVAQVEILDVAGRKLGSWAGSGGLAEVDIRASGLKAGIYLYRLKTVNGEVVAGKLVVSD